ncbi:hypothetical protein PC116_g17139 [Phytophthora cactorum]|uniref:Uncharacterized protein n=1 Tax=Phytophthora cactorum TaxID=29920 RepID=A0A329SBV8_9STRA|nr:hypothetical protein Pcac1_g10124 [Phytophthora cactorum]KAG2886160.1 hypothetical protein PC114_g19407 [Phytophthora cactorum]KAG2918619.1 hypothetical protein PC115_g10400 [Phytophthora cactorum]KAG2935982.1 hypothetical protein PC117_g12287 [Phytophthora cactorum]KAG3012820.1 hypothetical protein PC120_g13628 [Phytophthora cactorum]
MPQTDCQHVPGMKLISPFQPSPRYLSSSASLHNALNILDPGRSGDGTKAESDSAKISLNPPDESGRFPVAEAETGVSTTGCATRAQD